MGQRIKVRRDSSANWATSNPILADGEQGYDKTLKQYKTGDGITNWATLPFDRIDAANVVNLPAGFSGAYNDLTGKPVLFDGAYASLTGKPDLSGFQTSAQVDTLILAKGYQTAAQIQAYVIDGGNAAG